MDYFPIFLDIRNRPVVIVGGGEIAARKVALLRRAQAAITVVAPTLNDSLAQQLAQGELSYRAGEFCDDDLNRCALVVAATDDAGINRAVYEAAEKRNLPVNVVDCPEFCRFIFPSIVDRTPVTVAVSTSGASPVLARMLRAHLEMMIPAGYGRLASLLASFRDSARVRFSSMKSRRHFWERILQGPATEMVFSGREQDATRLIQDALNSGESAAEKSGEVALVGAGPGDPDLLTFRALRLMQQADVVLYDRLVSRAVLDLVRREAEQIYVGKKRDYHAVRQEEINQTLADLAKAGKRVVRLKGGDPFIFGRGGEEIATLAEQGVPFQVVPGITAASGCASYAGIPLTHRDYAQSVRFVTGQLKDGSIDLDWASLAQPQQTVVIYMGLQGLPVICKQLIAHGAAASLSVALVQQGTTVHQQVITGTLATLPALIAEKEIHAPTLLIVGEVVSLHKQLVWFQPLRND